MMEQLRQNERIVYSARFVATRLISDTADYTIEFYVENWYRGYMMSLIEWYLPMNGWLLPKGMLCSMVMAAYFFVFHFVAVFQTSQFLEPLSRESVHYTTSSYYMTKMFQMRMIQKSQHRLTKRTLMNKTLSRQVTMICHQVWGHLPTKMESSSLKSLIKTASRRISFITIPFNMSSTYWNGRMGMGWLRQQIFSSTCDWL